MITLEEVLSPENMQTACRRVIANRGAPGVDGMTVNEVRAHFEKHGASICAHIREGRYIPAAVKRVDIPKPNGGTRMLGIPTVQDRVIQQAIAQVLSKHFDPLFSEFSYGFRPGKSAHQAIEQTQKYIAEGRTWVVELDLAKFFDTVNHNRLMSKLRQHIEDKMLLRLIRRYLRTGIMSDGVVQVREEGTPQGSPLSPILSLIVLDELDKYLDKRGLKYCRFADDCNCYAKARNCQKVLCVFGLTGKPADFALKRLNPVLVIPNAFDRIAQRVDHQLHGVTFKAVDAFINLFIELINALWHNMSVFGK